MSTSPLVAYTKWHMWETLPRLATPIGLFLVLGALPIVTFANSQGLAALQVPGSSQNTALQIYSQMLQLCITIGAIVIASGIIALDRERQYFRFLFSHPLAPWQFYLQKYLISVLLFSISMMIIPLAFSWIVTPVEVFPVAIACLLYGLLYGSLAMLCGALFNKDGIAFIGAIVVTGALQASRQFLPGWLAQFSDALPPFKVADDMRSALLAGGAVDTGDVIHVIAYAVGMLAAALVLVRRAPLAR
jgi:ABC-type transport system involved in multi-copper enzyme maturation permease subunit